MPPQSKRISDPCKSAVQNISQCLELVINIRTVYRHSSSDIKRTDLDWSVKRNFSIKYRGRNMPNTVVY